MENLFQQAIIVATMAHKGQKRKGTKIPYIFHPMEVGQILAENNCREELIVAGILHDTIEDTELNSQAIEEMFGLEIRQLVEAASEPNRSDSWRKRKEHTLQFIKEIASREEKRLICADKLSNARSIYRDYIEQGNELWIRFNAGYEDQKWYYEGLISVFDMEDMRDCRMFKELLELVIKVFGDNK